MLLSCSIVFNLLTIMMAQFVPGFLVESGTDSQIWPINFSDAHRPSVTKLPQVLDVSSGTDSPMQNILVHVRADEDTQKSSINYSTENNDTDFCNPVAFSVSLSDNATRKAGENGVQVLFKKVNYNSGNGYNITGSFFTCLCPGIYFFSFHCLSPLQGRARLDLMVNQDRIISSEAPYYGYGTGSNSAIIKLKKKDLVFLVLAEGYLYENDAKFRGYTSFSGFKL